MKTKIVFKQGPKVVAEVAGEITSGVTVHEVATEVVKTEQFLERLTGLRVHIEVEMQGDGK